MRLLLILFFLVLSRIGFCQNNLSNDKSKFGSFLNKLSGSFESNAQWYVNDKSLGEFRDNLFPDKDEHVRANSYLNLNYSFLKNFSVGIQVESYEPLPLLNYYPSYNETNIASYYLNFKNKLLDITAGYFYEQFGSGLLLRTYEERQLGLNNALRGARIKCTPTVFLKLTALYGKQRVGFDISKGEILGFDTNIDLANALKIDNLNNFNFGLSYVGKKESFSPNNIEFNTTDFPEYINSYSARIDLGKGKFNMDIEYSIKGKDVAYTPPSLGLPEIIENKYFKGNALLFNLGFSQKGMGISGTFRRLENMGFYSERELNISGSNPFNMLNINYTPALTKQHDYSLANIYLYQSQSYLLIQNFAGQAGEIGGQIDVFYNIKKGSGLGGKYGTKITANFSYWALLNATFNESDYKYSTDFLKFGKPLSTDFNIEIRKKWSKNWSSIFTYISAKIDKGTTLGGPLGVQGTIKSDITTAEFTHKFNKGKSIRLETQHLWTKQDKKNWAGGTVEFNLNRNFSIYLTDIYNYGNDESSDQIHYYNFGGSYTKGATRISLNYGRQRGGLLCVGGICRFVPENTGLSLNLATSF